jgi:uncharacterized protein
MDDILAQPWFWPSVIIVFGSATFQGASGFGMALIALPLLMALMGPQMAVPVVTFANLVPPLVVLWVYRRHWQPRLTAWLGVPTLMTAPLGVHLLKIMTAPQLKMALGGILIASAAWHFLKSYFWPKTFSPDAVAGGSPKHSRVACVLVGAFSGVLGGAMGMTGPLLADFLVKSGLGRESFKVTLNIIFLASATWRTGLYAVQGVTTNEAFRVGMVLLPVGLLATILGLMADKHIPAKKFIGYTQVALLMLGVWTFYNGCCG